MATPNRTKVFSFLQDFGGVGDGKSMNTKAFREAIEAIQLYNTNNPSANGAELVVGDGSTELTFLTAPFNLTSHMTITLASRACLFASDDVSLWPVVPPLPSYGQGRDHPGPRHAPFLGGWHLTDIVLRGPGCVDGNGFSWWARHKGRRETYTRGRLFETLYSDGILLENVHLKNSPFWTVHPTYSSNIVARFLTIDNPSDSPNTDGFDPDSSVNVSLTDSFFSVGDDGVAIKSGWDCFGLDVNQPCKNIHIRNLTVNSPCCAGICIGSEMSGGVENVLVEDIRLLTVGQGLRVKAGLGRGGYVRNITYERVLIDDALNVALQLNDHYGSANPSCHGRNASAVPKVYDLVFRNVSAKSKGVGADFEGLPQQGGEIHDIFLEEVNIQSDGVAWKCSEVKGSSTSTVHPAPCKSLQ
jgi:polygalacturonase|eukprot:Stramenopile-MAST_4_protein_625